VSITRTAYDLHCIAGLETVSSWYARELGKVTEQVAELPLSAPIIHAFNASAVSVASYPSAQPLDRLTGLFPISYHWTLRMIGKLPHSLSNVKWEHIPKFKIQNPKSKIQL
jgi:hypothetical protein